MLLISKKEISIAYERKFAKKKFFFQNIRRYILLKLKFEVVSQIWRRYLVS